jgi:hypothetical protein
MCCNADPDQLSAIYSHYDVGVEQVETDGRDNEQVRRRQSALLALPCFFAFIHRLQAKRRASISGGELGSPLLAIAYANINVATSRQRGARGDKG